MECDYPTDNDNALTVTSTKKQLDNPKRTIFNVEPTQMVEYATSVANALSDVIERQKLYTVISNKKYVRTEGWTTLGVMLGVMPVEDWIRELPDGSYEAKINLVKQADGILIGGASALCSIDEPRWGKAEKYARRSMAVTRATGKAYRLCFSWILSLAGYEVTPAEEMPIIEEKKMEPKKTASIYTGTTEQQEKVKQYLEAHDIPDALWGLIDEKLMNKPSTELKRIITEVMTGAN